MMLYTVHMVSGATDAVEAESVHAADGVFFLRDVERNVVLAVPMSNVDRITTPATIHTAVESFGDE